MTPHCRSRASILLPFHILIFIALAAGLGATAAGADLHEMFRRGNADNSLLAFPGFGANVVTAASFELTNTAPASWTEQEKLHRLKLKSYSVELREAGPDWDTLRGLMPALAAEDQVDVQRIFWTGISCWMADITLAAQVHAKEKALRQRWLIAPVGEKLLVMVFKGPLHSFEQEREAMRKAAMSVRFRVNGLLAEYYDSLDLNNLTRLQVDPTIDFDWGESAAIADLGPDVFSVRWTGKIRPRHSETYTFITNSDDGVRLWINNRLVVENWTEHPATEDSGTIELTADKEYDLKMEWFENGGFAVAQLYWESPSQDREIVPASQLSARPEPGFAPMPEPIDRNKPIDYGGLPELHAGDAPGGYLVKLPPGYRFEGKRPEQTMVFGRGRDAVYVTLKKMPVDIPNAKSLLPDFKPSDEVVIKPVLWQETPTWSVVCDLDADAHPELKRHHQRYYLVPLKSGMLVFLFESENADWLKLNRDDFLAVFQGVKLTAEAQEQPQGAAVRDAIF